MDEVFIYDHARPRGRGEMAAGYELGAFQGVLLSATDGDLGAVLGVGFPAHLGGPFVAMDQIGIPEVVSELDRLRDSHGEQFEVPDLLRQMADRGETFYGKNAVASPGALGRTTDPKAPAAMAGQGQTT